MAPLLRVDGSWPGSVTITAGWFRARARPWNDVITDPMVRLDRGGAEFLKSVTRRLIELGAEALYSPALYPSAAGVWRRSGFGPYAELAVMERSLARNEATPAHTVTSTSIPDWESMMTIDRAAFEGFWGMSVAGLKEAFRANRTTTLLETRDDDVMTGYAIVGHQWAVTYLHRIAVHPDRAGNGLGRALLESAIAWGRANGSRSMVLNVRDINHRAQSLYERCGFTHTGTRLVVLRGQPDDVPD